MPPKSVRLENLLKTVLETKIAMKVQNKRFIQTTRTILDDERKCYKKISALYRQLKEMADAAEQSNGEDETKADSSVVPANDVVPNGVKYKPAPKSVQNARLRSSESEESSSSGTMSSDARTRISVNHKMLHKLRSLRQRNQVTIGLQIESTSESSYPSP